MARTFARATVDRVTLSIGALNFVPPVTLAALVRKTTDLQGEVIFRAGTGAGASWWLNSRAADNKLEFSNQTTQAVAATMTLTVADGWCLVGTSKATGTVAPRFHKYVISTNTWTHENSGTTIADPTTPGTNAFIGSSGASSGFDGDIAVEGVWNVVLSDAQVETLPFSLAAWRQIDPKGLWLLDQQATAQKVRDLTGNGANESSLTGTSVATTSVPLFSYGAPLPRVQIQPAAVVGGGSNSPRDLILLGAG